jgi:hypothetical protein
MTHTRFRAAEKSKILDMNYIKETNYGMAVGHLYPQSFWDNKAVF